MLNLNQRAFDVCQRMIAAADELRIEKHKTPSGASIIDCGINAPGGLEAGRMLAECCMAGLGKISFAPAAGSSGFSLSVQVYSDQPLAACMAAQYAGWEVKVGDYFAMGSGPMRAAANREKIYEEIGYAERPSVAVGVLETRVEPTTRVTSTLATACGVAEEDLLLLVAPTASLAGTVQVVARSVETAMHKLHELGFDLEGVQSGYGSAPLPPVAADDLAGIGRTNDAVLYGAHVTLWVRGNDDLLKSVGPRIPSNSSGDHGEPFAKIFARYDHDFYKIDRALFSPAVVTLINCDTGRSFTFGETMPDLLRESFAL